MKDRKKELYSSAVFLLGIASFAATLYPNVRIMFSHSVQVVGVLGLITCTPALAVAAWLTQKSWFWKLSSIIVFVCVGFMSLVVLTLGFTSTEDILGILNVLASIFLYFEGIRSAVSKDLQLESNVESSHRRRPRHR